MKQLISTGHTHGDVIVDTCLNLRPTTDGLHLTVADTPQHLGHLQGFTPIAVYSQDPPIIILHKNLEVIVLEVNTDNVSQVPLGQLPGTPGAHFFKGDQLAVMTKNGPWFINRDSDGHWHSLQHPHPNIPVIIRAQSSDTYQTTINLPDMDEALTSLSINIPSVRRKILAPIDRAYTDAYLRAHADGVLTAPVVARATLTYPDGRLLFTSPPVLLTPPLMSDNSDSVLSFDSEDRKTFSPSPLSITTYRPEVIITESLPDDINPDDITVSLWLSPLLGGIDIGGAHLINIGRTPGKGWLKVTPSRLDYSVVADRPQSSYDTVQRVLSRIDTLLTSRCHPFKYSIGVHPQFVYSPSTIKSDIPTLLTSSVDTSRLPLTPLSPPHIITADTVFAHAPIVVWGKVKASLFDGYSPLCYATAYEHQHWRARTLVTMDNGHSGVIWQGEGNDYAPTAMGPLITYPLLGATSITIIVELADGRTISWHRQLSSSPDSSYSSFLDTTLKESLGIPADEPSLPDLPLPENIDFSDYLVTASIDDPFTPLALTHIDAPATALTPAFNINRLSNFDTTRLYAMTPSGIYDVSIDSSGQRVRFSLLSPCPVHNSNHVCVGANATYILADSHIIAVSAGRAITTIPWIADARAIGWDSRHRCLTAAITDGNTHNYLPNMAMQYYQTDPVNTNIWLSENGHIITRAQDGNLILLSRGHTAGSTHIIWQATMPVSRNKQQAKITLLSPLTTTMSLPLDASVIDGAVTISRDYLTSRRAPMTRLSIHGPVHHPLHLPLYPHRHPSLHISLDAEATPDLRLDLPRFQETRREI